jgi:hypothetical protein
MEYQLTYFDTVSVQDYIFNSNKLRHVIGASGLVHQATNDWIFKILDQLGPTNVDNKGVIDESVQIDHAEVQSELVYAGGGNALILFKPGKHIEFARLLSLMILKEAPGLDFVICHVPVDWDSKLEYDQLRYKLAGLIWKASLKKQSRSLSTPLPGLGVTVICPYTGKPATGRKKGVRVSSEILAKEKAFQYADKRLNAVFGKHDYMYDLDQISGVEKGSYIGVVHSDGTDMGRRIQRLAQQERNADNRVYIRCMRAFSESIKRASTSAMSQTINRLVTEQAANPEKIRLTADGKLPFRPIVYGGDDVTFVCDGMFALSLAAFHLQQLSLNNLADGRPIFARSGVAIVKSHFPFSEAYTMASELNQEARRYAKEVNNDAPPTTLDWYFTSSGPVLDLSRIRAAKYKRIPGKPDHTLMFRPLVVCGPNPDSLRTWATFLQIIADLRSNLTQTQRNALFQVLPQGPDKVKEHKLAKNITLPTIHGYSGPEENAWRAYDCVCHDPLEAMDFMDCVF